jgi:type II secretory pathway component PulC
MAEHERLTPEKQLLNLIENPKGEQIKAENLKRQGKKWFSLGALKGRLSFSSDKRPSFKDFVKAGFGVKQINLSLKISIIFLAIYLSYNVVVMALELKKASNLIFTADKIPADSQEHTSPLKEMQYYLKKPSARNLFDFGASPKIEPKKELPSAAPLAVDYSKDFSLVGIAWSANPEAMIEDVKNKRTHFARQGQLIEGRAKVVAIFKDRVMLNVEGKEFELK